jgi:RHS repeat-associated protein
LCYLIYFYVDLGNVTATISDRKISIAIGAGNGVASYTPEVLSEQDYFPFGMGMMGRSVTAEGYRYGYNGMEKESETFEGAYDFGARILDTRLGRWLSVDPLYDEYINLSTYNFVRNNPLLFWDPDGKKIFIHYKDENGVSRLLEYHPGIDPGNADLFVKQVHEAISENIKYDVSETWQKMDEDEDIVYIEYNTSKDQAEIYTENCGNGYETHTTIYWNPETALETADGGGLAPSTKLFHGNPSANCILIRTYKIIT